ncbi:hypothetical protein F4802DRAFT_601418 [Xylaria palmicola]|nr:hypothetical protein F4802DRAFT_601418 [Xylaria palmicola]
MAAEALYALSVDLVNMLQHQPPAGPTPYPNQIVGYDDAVDLILLLRYIAAVLLRAAADQRRQMLIINGGPTTADDTMFYWRRDHIWWNAIRAEAYIRGTTAFGLAMTPGYRNIENGWQAAAGPSVPNIPALGTVELLCRVIADGCLNMNAFDNRVTGNNGAAMIPGLSLRNVPTGHAAQQWLRVRKGIPGTVFLCTDDDGATGAPPMIVVTTSQDVWGAFSRAERWARSNRQTLARLGWRLNADSHLVRAHSNTVRTAFRNIPNIAGLTPVNRRNARQAVINANNGLMQINHGAETATPLHCPQFTLKPRCLRCQTLFMYNVPNNVILEEQRMLGYVNPRCRTSLCCAETIAYYQCIDAGH